MIHRIFPRMKIVNLALRYPQNYMIRNPLKGALILFLFITSFTLLYQPMNAHGSRWFNFQFTMLIYAFASSMAACLIMWILARTKYFGDRKRWTLPKELLAIYLVLQVMELPFLCQLSFSKNPLKKVAGIFKHLWIHANMPS
jgi:hypothetical protein